MAIEILMFICGVGAYTFLQYDEKEMAYWLFLLANLLLSLQLLEGNQYIALAMISVYQLFCIYGIYKLSRDKAVSSHHENNNNRTDVFINADRRSIPEKYRNYFSKY